MCVGAYPKGGSVQGGVEAYLCHLAEALHAQRGIPLEVHIIAIGNDGPGSDVLRKQDMTLEHTLRRSAWGLLALARRLRTLQPDVVHLQHETFLYGGPACFFLFPLVVRSMRRHSRVIVTLHHVVDRDEITQEFRRIHGTRAPCWLLRASYRWFYRMMGRAADVLLVHEERNVHTLRKTYGIHTAVQRLPHGIEPLARGAAQHDAGALERFKVDAQATYIFGFFGYLAAYKGIDYLLEEFARHRERHPTSALLICSGLHPRLRHDARYASAALALEQRARATPGVTWHGFLPEEDIPTFFSFIDCLVLPYRMCIGTSGPLSWSIGSLTPCLHSSCIRLVEGGGDAFSFELTQGALAEKMDMLSEYRIGDMERELALFRRAREEWSWQRIAEKVAKIYANREP